MLDTVRISATVEKDGGELMRRGFTRSTYERLDAENHTISEAMYAKHIRGGSPHFIKYVPGRGELVTETSLPKVLHGENITLISPADRNRVFDELSNRISNDVGDIPAVGDWEIRGRADFCFAWLAREGKACRVGDYLGALQAVHLSRMKGETIEKEATQYWFNKQRRLRFYDKFAETKDPKAADLLRFEVQFNHAKRELAKFGIGNTLGEVCTWETAYIVLNDWLSKIGATAEMGDEERIARVLLQAMKPSQARSVMGALVYERLFTSRQLNQLKFPKAMLSRDRQKVLSAGLGKGVAQRGTLPPLTIPRPGKYDGSPVNPFKE